MEKNKTKIFCGVAILVFALLFAIPKAFAVTSVFQITAAEITAKSATVDSDISAFDGTSVTSNVTFHQLSDTITYKLTLENTDSKEHELESITDDNSNTYVSYNYDDHAGEIIAAGDSFEFEFTVKYENAVSDTSLRMQTSGIKFYLKFVGEEPEALMVVPNTGATTKDSGKEIIVNIPMLVVTALGLTACLVIVFKSRKKSSKTAILFFAIVAGLSIAASVDAVSIVTNNITINSTLGFFDKLVVSYDNNQKIINYGDKLEDANIEAPEKVGYSFSHWEYTDGSNADFTANVYEDTTIVPKYNTIEYTISYDLDGGNASNPGTYTVENEVRISDPTKADFIFEGWTGTDLDAPTKNLVIPQGSTGARSYTATWSAFTYDIVYDGNGSDNGEMNVSHSGVKKDDKVVLYSSNYAKSGFGFAGWSPVKTTDPNNLGSNPIYGPSETIEAPSYATYGADGKITLYAIWVESTGDMQGWAGCPSLPALSVTALTDSRDGNVYTVAKLADGKCWMVENLRLDAAGKTLDSTNTNNPNSDFTTAVANLGESTFVPCSSNSCTNQYSAYTGNINGENSSPTDRDVSRWYSYGAQYNWYTAVAGTGSTNAATYTITSGDICPAGWKLPQGQTSSEGEPSYVGLATALGAVSLNEQSSMKWRAFPYNMILPGYYYSSIRNARGATGIYWTNTTANFALSGYAFHLGTNGVAPQYVIDKYQHLSVRCVKNDVFDVELVVNNGTGSDTKTVKANQNAVFNDVAPNTMYTLEDNVSCTNGQTATYANGKVTVNNVTNNTTCTLDAIPPTIHSITYMQEMTPEICAATTTPIGSLATAGNDDWDGSHYGDSNYIPRKALIDSRDNKKYLVAKLADGECWMTQNLGLDLSTETTFTSSNTDLNTISSYTPARNTETIPTSGSPYGNLANASNLQLSWYTYSPYYVGNDTYANLGLQRATSPTCDSDECLWQTAGNIYTYYALSAGTYPYNGGSGVRIQDTLCPKGWTLPEGQNLKDEEGFYTQVRLPKSYYVLYNAYSPNTSADEYMAFTRSGIFRPLFVGSYRSYVNSYNRPPEYYQELYRGAYATNFIADYHEQSNRVVSTQLQWHNGGTTTLGTEISAFGADGMAARCIAR